MVTYKSAKGRTLSVGRLQISVDTGVTLDSRDKVLDELVDKMFLTRESDEPEAEVPEVGEPVVLKVEQKSTVKK